MDDDEREFQRAVTEGLLPKLSDSDYCVSIAPDGDGDLDAKFCVELGAMIVLNKPIITIVSPGRSIGQKLMMVSDRVVYADVTTEEGRAAIQTAVEKFGETL